MPSPRRRRPAVDLRRHPRQDRSRQTVAFVLEAAAQVFGEHGHAATTTDRVAERAGVSIGTLYQYFPNKDALLLALARDHLARAEDELAARTTALRREAPALDVVARALVETVVALNARPVHALIVDEAARPPELGAALAALRERIAAELAWHLRRAGTGGDDPELAALVLVHAVDAVVHELVIRPPAGRTSEQCVEQTLALLGRALRP